LSSFNLFKWSATSDFVFETFKLTTAEMLGNQDYDSTPPKMSPRGGIPDRGSRSPAVARNEPSSTGTLKLNISLGKNPSIIHSGPFYCLKEPPEQEKMTGESNLISEYNLEHAYQKFNGKKVKEPLSSFLPNLPGIVDTIGENDNSSLRSVIEKPPITGKEIEKLSMSQLSGFRLHPGPLPEQYRQSMMQPPAKKKLKKNRYEKDRVGLDPACPPVEVPESALADCHPLIWSPPTETRAIKKGRSIRRRKTRKRRRSTRKRNTRRKNTRPNKTLSFWCHSNFLNPMVSPRGL